MVHVRQTFQSWRQGWVNYFARPRRVALGTTLAVTLLLLGMAQLSSEFFISRQLNNDRQQVSAELMGFGNALTISLQHRIALLEGLETFAAAELNAPQAAIQSPDFAAVAASLYESSAGIRYFALAPGGVQSFVYPLAGNADALQHDLLGEERPQVAASVQAAIQQHGVALSSVFPLEQGRQGLLVTRAIYLGDRFWGLAVMELDLTPVFVEAGLELPPRGTDLMISDGVGQTIMGGRAVLDENPVLWKIDVPGKTWQIAAAPSGGWQARQWGDITLFRLAGFLIAGLLGIVVYLVTDRQARLALSVQQRTQELTGELNERKRAEQALSESQRTLFTMMSNLPGLAYRCKNDPQWTMEFVSEGCAALTGYQPADLIGNARISFNDLIHPDDRVPGWVAVQEAVQEGLPYQLEYRILTASGEMRWVWEQGRGVLDSDGQVVALEGLVIDITERKQADSAMEESENRYRTVLNEAPDAIFIITEDDEIVDANPAACQMLGYSREELVKLKLADVIAEESRIQPENIIQTELNLGSFESVDIHRDGHRIPVEVRARRMVGTERLAVSIVRDITERKQVEQALRENEEKYRSLFESSADGILLGSIDAHVLDCNPAACQLYGYTKEELVGLTIYDLTTPEMAAMIPATLVEELAKGGVFLQVPAKTKDGRVFPAEVSTRVVTLLGEKQVISFVRDITERKRSEREQEAIARVASALRIATTNSEIAPVILNQLLDLMAAQGGALFTYDPAGGESTCTLGIGLWEHWSGVRLGPGEGAVGRMMLTGEPYLNNAIYPDDPVAHLDLTREVKSIVGVPMVIQGQTRGALWVGGTSQFLEGEVHLLAAITDMAAATLHRASLHEETQQRVQRLSALHQIDTTINGSLDLAVILSVLLDQLINQLGADATTVWLYDPDLRVLRFVTGRGFRKGGLSGLEVRLGDGFAGRIALTRLPLVIEDLAQLGNLTASNQWAAEQFTTYHGVPLIAKGEVQGVLEVFHRRWVGPDPEWMEFLETLASQAAIAINNAMLFENLQRSNLELELAYDTTLEGWARALELRDRETEGHTRRVVDMTIRLASALGISQQSLVNVRRGALLHDIGKLGIPDYILLKPASLTEEEWKIMRMHPVYAYQLLSPISYLRPALDIPYSHHERWDGSGYPQGLRGDAIPLAARAFAVIDVWDALLSNRPYSPAWSNAQMQAYLREESGQQFDPHVVEVFFQVLREQK